MARTAPTRPLPKIIALSLLLYRWLLSLGPGAFRRDYAAPALQDFRQCCRDAYQKQGSFGVLRLWPGLLGETIPGLLAEYLTELFGRKRPMLPTVRRSMVTTFWAFVLFLFAYAAFGRTVPTPPLRSTLSDTSTRRSLSPTLSLPTVEKLRCWLSFWVDCPSCLQR